MQPRAVRATVVADLRPYVDRIGDISDLALIHAPIAPPGSSLLVLLGRARVDSRQVIRRALTELGWQQAARITFAGIYPEFVDQARDVAR